MATMSKGNNNSLAVKRSATGLGLFTLKPIPASRRIIEYVGQIIDSEEADRRGGKYLFELDEERAIDGTARSNTARYINHSCRPNAEAFTHGNRIWIWSRRKIKAGEEITIHYGKDYLAEHIDPKGCKCQKCIARPKKAKRVRGKKGGRK
jgi:SET domain-containing protein